MSSDPATADCTNCLRVEWGDRVIHNVSSSQVGVGRVFTRPTAPCHWPWALVKRLDPPYAFKRRHTPAPRAPARECAVLPRWGQASE